MIVRNLRIYLKYELNTATAKNERTFCSLGEKKMVNFLPSFSNSYLQTFWVFRSVQDKISKIYEFLKTKKLLWKLKSYFRNYWNCIINIEEIKQHIFIVSVLMSHLWKSHFYFPENSSWTRIFKRKISSYFFINKPKREIEIFSSKDSFSLQNFVKMKKFKRKTIYLDEEKYIEISFEADCLR